jgi:O-antigen ligase
MIALFYVAAIPSAVFFVRSQRAVVALLKAILWTSIVVTFILTAYVVDPDLFQIDAFLNRVGRSRTLTGRLDLWTLGWQAFLERPLVGWGFDNLLTLSAQSLNRISYGQFHNGYLDMLVRGGILGALIAVTFIGVLTLRILNAMRWHREPAVLMLILLAGILAHNLTETSLMQFPNALWMITVSLHYVTFALQGRQPQASRPIDRPAMSSLGTYAYSRNYRATPWRA